MIDLLIGLHVADEQLYSAYRAHMTPLLQAHGGSFGVDVRVAEVLRSPQDKPFNRLFTMRFPSTEQLTAFFENPDYLAIRRQFLEPSVSATTRFAKYEVLE